MHSDPTRKRRTRGHVIADLSVNHVERFILQCGWAAQRMTPDYGIDLELDTFDERGCIENGVIKFQLKASDSPRIITGRQVVAVRLDWRDVLYWLNELMPGILIVYDALKDCAWWVCLQEELRTASRRMVRRPTRTLTVHVPLLANVFNTEAIRKFAGFRDAVLAERGDSRS